MKLGVKKFAEAVGVSVRTLHYYDEIGLLKPDFVDGQSGYRFYGDAAFCRMQQILFYRELDFSLGDIQAMISSPNDNKREALRAQKRLLLLKKERLEGIIAAIERAEKGEDIDMSILDNSEFQKSKNTYREEVQRRFGNTDAYAEHMKKTAGYTKGDWDKVGEGMEAILTEMGIAHANGISATDQGALDLVKKLRDFITETQYTCTMEILLSLGDMYVTDARFQKNIDRHGKGTAEFINAAIKAYCKIK